MSVSDIAAGLPSLVSYPGRKRIFHFSKELSFGEESSFLAFLLTWICYLKFEIEEYNLQIGSVRNFLKDMLFKFRWTSYQAKHDLMSRVKNISFNHIIKKTLKLYRIFVFIVGI